MKVLFLCTGNTCRSQMAEGWARCLRPDIEPYSAGTELKPLDDRAVRAMAEIGVDISSQWPKHANAVRDVPFDMVVTVCDSAREACPIFPASVRTQHTDFDDPPRLAASAMSEEEAMSHYRRIRDEIRIMVESLPRTNVEPWPVGPRGPGDTATTRSKD